MDMTYNDRFKGTLWVNYNPHITIVGAGSIGSWTTLALSKITDNIKVYDDDVVETTNIGGQFYSINNIGHSKCKQLHDNILLFSGSDLNYRNQKANKEELATVVYNDVDNILISAVDNMSSRKEIFEAFKASNFKLLIDGRLSLETFYIYVVDKSKPDNIALYEQSLFEDSEATEEICTLKVTTHSAMMIASMITSIYTNFAENQLIGMELREVPYLTEGFIPEMKIRTKTENN